MLEPNFSIPTRRALRAGVCTGNMTVLKEVVDGLYAVVLKSRSSHAGADQVWFQLSAFADHMSAVSGDLWRELLANNLAGSNVHVDINDTVVVHSSRLLPALDELFAEYARTPERLLEGIAWLVIERFLWAAGEMPSLRFAVGYSELLLKRAACIDLVDSQLGLRSAAGWLRDRFNATNRSKLDNFLGGLVWTLRESLAKLSWIDQESMREATLKLSNLKFEALPGGAFFSEHGVADLFREFDAAVGNVSEAASFMRYFMRFSQTLRGYLGSDRCERVYRRRFAKSDTKPAEYFYYTNSIRVSLASIEPPLYSTDGTLAMNYAGLGSYVARELSRALDDVGTLVDFQGLTRTWWGPTKSKEYRDKLACEFDTPSPDDRGVGNTSAGEDVDHRLGLFPHVPALETAYRAYKRAVAADVINRVDVLQLPYLEDYTDDQVFFLTYCHALGAPAGDRYARKLCNVPLRNFRPFAEAFRCIDGSPMSPKKKCTFLYSS
ncbi:hypothetical protein HPB50_024169 [Hyalomma asiaticum]|uniref:Uncharacterized protein n=1 Tax=Hyalomma asiaticum TaxID=266040 RepID=A0ACB7SKF8_HYAAI|nr:hypothetical protein HPB50_024169 [Hyalomma asiaticum]